jgi:hypothetical protein
MMRMIMMSKFKVGDRIKYDGDFINSYRVMDVGSYPSGLPYYKIKRKFEDLEYNTRTLSVRYTDKKFALDKQYYREKRLKVLLGQNPSI